MGQVIKCDDGGRDITQLNCYCQHGSGPHFAFIIATVSFDDSDSIVLYYIASSQPDDSLALSAVFLTETDCSPPPQASFSTFPLCVFIGPQRSSNRTEQTLSVLHLCPVGSREMWCHGAFEWRFDKLKFIVKVGREAGYLNA